MTTELHPAVGPLAHLVGVWTGAGHGVYPTIEPFDYEETVTFSHVGKAFLTYAQSTSDPVDGRLLHGETGYWRMAGNDRAEVVIAQSTGLAEVAEGAVSGGAIRLRSTGIARTATAKEVSAVERDVDVDGDTLRYSLRMAAMGRPLSLHLTGELHRVR